MSMSALSLFAAINLRAFSMRPMRSSGEMGLAWSRMDFKDVIDSGSGPVGVPPPRCAKTSGAAIAATPAAPAARAEVFRKLRRDDDMGWRLRRRRTIKSCRDVACHAQLL